jgi:hypothetical protein
VLSAGLARFHYELPDSRLMALWVSRGELSPFPPQASWTIAAPNRLAHNDPGAPRVVDIRQEPYRGGQLQVPALGVALFELPAR